MKLVKSLIVLVALFSIQNAFAQQALVWNHYIYNPHIHNPSRVGEEDLGNVFFNFKKQWSNMPDAPLSNLLSFDMPVGKTDLGVGAKLILDRAHAWHTTNALLSVAYHIPFNKDRTHKLSIGVDGGVLNYRLDFSELTFNTDLDPVEFADDERVTTFDGNVGINYNWKGLNLGFSVPHIFSNESNFESNEVNKSAVKTMVRHYLASAGYRAAVGKNKDFFIEPSVLVRKVKGIPLQFDINAIIDWNNTVWANVGYRSGSGSSGFADDAAGLHAGLGAGFKERAEFTYTFETLLGKADRSSFGYTHEILVGVKIGKGLKDLEKKQDELFDGIRKNAGAITAQGERMDGIEEEIDKTNDLVNQNINNINEQGTLIRDLDGKIDDNIGSLKDLKDRVENDPTGLVLQKIGSVYFKSDSDELTPEATARLDAMKAAISTPLNRFVVYVSGNASEEGAEEYNYMLSARRSATVKKYLQGIGIAKEIFVLPYGEESPVTENQATEEERAQNRRVDIFIFGE